MDEIEQIFQEIASKPVDDEIKDIDPNSRIVELDSHWLKIEQNLNIWRFIHEMQESKLHHKDEYRPLLLIHGYKSSHVTWNWIVQRLWATGFRNIFGIELLDDKLGLKRNSEHIEEVLQFIFEMLPEIKEIDMIGHSMGGLVARYFTKYSEMRNRVRLLVTLGSAHSGLSLAFDILIRTIGKAKTWKDLSSRKNGLLAQMRDTTVKEDIKITMLNIGGSLRRYRGSDGFVRPVPLNDMINKKVRFKHSMLNKNETTFSYIYNLLTRKVYILKLSLVELTLTKELEEPENYYLKFSVPFNKYNQRYPVENPLYLKPGDEKIKPDFPVVIFSEDILSDQQVMIGVRFYKSRFLKHKRLSTTRFLIGKNPKKSIKKPFQIGKKGYFQLKLQFNVYHLSI